ncbi:MAG: molybdopterin-binding/glycosyltransferase family 2 protein [Myxococcota bacterium]
MKFGRVPLREDSAHELEGAILAHTHRLKPGGAVKKGRRLDADDLRRLLEGGVQEVTVATLEPTDVHEDAAAARIAMLFSDPTLSLSDAHTGRVNVHAAAPGLVVVDEESIHAINRVSEEVTIATVPNETVAPNRVMEATIKIIPFAVDESILHAIEKSIGARRNEGKGPLKVAPFRARSVGLILSQLPGMSPTLLRKASDVQRARVSSLGGTIARELRCDHDADVVARAIQTLREESCDPILILGASAIVDRRDVIPDALERSGGAVVHLGMPVDPGNLLMYGRYDDATVLGLPGCARSLNLSGFDFVLRRVMADLPVDSSVIAALGVGGLLKEIPSRPQPRSMRKKELREPRVAGIVLAAGMSRRMGKTNKLLAEVDGVPLVVRVSEAMLRSKAAPVYVVVGHEAEHVRAALRGLHVRIIDNPDFADGLSTSVAAGIRALEVDSAQGQIDGAVIGLGDMPWVDEIHIDALVDAFDPDGESTICVPMYGRKRGNPVLWSATHFAELEKLEGDVGGKVLFDRFAASVCYVSVADASVNVDVDTPEALAELQTSKR